MVASLYVRQLFPLGEEQESLFRMLSSLTWLFGYLCLFCTLFLTLHHPGVVIFI